MPASGGSPTWLAWTTAGDVTRIGSADGGGGASRVASAPGGAVGSLHMGGSCTAGGEDSGPWVGLTSAGGCGGGGSGGSAFVGSGAESDIGGPGGSGRGGVASDGIGPTRARGGAPAPDRPTGRRSERRPGPARAGWRFRGSILILTAAGRPAPWAARAAVAPRSGPRPGCPLAASTRALRRTGRECRPVPSIRIGSFESQSLLLFFGRMNQDDGRRGLISVVLGRPSSLRTAARNLALRAVGCGRLPRRPPGSACASIPATACGRGRRV